jgi:hypothetical protein
MEDAAAEIPISEMGGGLQWLVRSTPCKRSSAPAHRYGFRVFITRYLAAVPRVRGRAARAPRPADAAGHAGWAWGHGRGGGAPCDRRAVTSMILTRTLRHSETAFFRSILT